MSASRSAAASSPVTDTQGLPVLLSDGEFFMPRAAVFRGAT